MMTITLPPELEIRLKDEVLRRGVDAAQYARELIERSLTAAGANGGTGSDQAQAQAPAGPKPAAADQATIDLLDQWERDTATDDPAEIARRRQEFEEFKAGM